MKKKEEKKQTIQEIVEEVKTDMCDNYCKYPNEIKDDERKKPDNTGICRCRTRCMRGKTE